MVTKPAWLVSTPDMSSSVLLLPPILCQGQGVLRTHGAAKHGNTTDEELVLVLLDETDPAGRAEDAVLGLGLGRSDL